MTNAIGWIDLETSSLEPHGEWAHVLEVAIVLTDRNLEVLAEKQWLVLPPLMPHITRGSIVRVLRARTPEVIRHMHDENALWEDLMWLEADVAAGKWPMRPGVDVVTGEASAWLEACAQELGVEGRLEMGGSGVDRFDRQWLKAKMPVLETMFDYWSYDEGSNRRTLTNLFGLTPPPERARPADRKHRALADVHATIQGMRDWREIVRRGA